MAIAETELRLTLDQFLALPDEEPALEFDEGKVTQKVSPKLKHSQVQVELVARIQQFARPRALALPFSELRTTFAGKSYVPDVAIIRWARIPSDPDGRLADDFLEAPDVAVEIVSPGQRVNTLIRRCVWYVENGVSIALLLDPLDESVVAFRPSQQPRSLTGSDRIDLSEVLPGFDLTCQDLFDSLRVR